MSPESSGEFITLARVVKTQGRHGEVAVEVHSDVPDRFAAGMRLSALLPDGLRQELQIESLWPHKNFLVLKFVGVDSISHAEPLVRCELQVPRSQRAHLKAGWNYVSDLIGCTVFDHGREIGRIEDVRSGAGEAPLLIVADSVGTRFDVPYAEAYLEGTDIARKQVRMKLPEGMLEINAPLAAEEKRQQQAGRRKRP